MVLGFFMAPSTSANTEHNKKIYPFLFLKGGRAAKQIIKRTTKNRKEDNKMKTQMSSALTPMDLLSKLNAIYEGAEPSVELIRHNAKLINKNVKPKLHVISKAA